VAFVDSFLGFCHAWVILVFNYLKNVVTSADLFTFGNSKLCTYQFSTLTPAGFGSVFLVPLQFSLCKFLDRIWRFTSYWRWGSMDKATVHVCGYGRVNMLGIVLFFFLFLFLWYCLWWNDNVGYIFVNVCPDAYFCWSYMVERKC
jgi:hypothetical protein